MINLDNYLRFLYKGDEIHEFIVKYNGDLEAVANDLNASYELLDEGYAIITMRAANAPLLYDYSQIEYVEIPKKLFLSISNSLNYSCIIPAQRESSFGLKGTGVIVGIIDSGIDFTHPEFIRGDGTSRILYIWDQNISGNPPEGFNIGSEYDNNEINEALQNSNPFSAVPSEDTIGHGTAVAGVACGANGAAPDSLIISVKLRSSTEENYSRTTDVMRAIKYIIDKSMELNMPCAINLSYGTNDGSHYGQSLFESYIDAMAARWKNVIVVASGNEAASNHHYSGVVGQGDTVNIDFTIATYSKTMYLSLWKNFADTMSFEIIMPSGKSTGQIQPTQTFTQNVIDNVRITVLYGLPTHYSPFQEVYVYFESLTDSIENGIASIVARGIRIINGTINIWLPTDEEVTPNTAFFDVDTDMTMTLPSTANLVIAVGGYRGDTDTVSVFSGRGTDRCGQNVIIDLVAPAENVLTSRAGGGFTTYTGTSIAAPFVTGSAALMMEWGIIQKNDYFLYGQRIKAFLQRNATRIDYLEYPNHISGYGMLNLCNTLSDLKNYDWNNY